MSYAYELGRRSSRLLLCLGLIALVAACTRPSLDDYRQETPTFDPAVYFDGRVDAWGLFQDRFGKVRTRFVVTIDGSVDNGVLTLIEDFVYDDGREEQRVWTLEPKAGDSAGRWTGRAAGVVGNASGRTAGNAFSWRYTIDLPLGDDETMRVDFDDWIWLIDQETAINRAYVSRFGVDIGEVIIFFKRSEPAGVTPAGRLAMEDK